MEDFGHVYRWLETNRRKHKLEAHQSTPESQNGNWLTKIKKTDAEED